MVFLLHVQMQERAVTSLASNQNDESGNFNVLAFFLIISMEVRFKCQGFSYHLSNYLNGKMFSTTRYLVNQLCADREGVRVRVIFQLLLIQINISLSIS